MKVNGKHYRTIWLEEEDGNVTVIDQRLLPHIFATKTVTTCDGMCTVIRDMYIRGAGLVGASAAAGMHLAARQEGGKIILDCAAAANNNNVDAVALFMEAMRKAGRDLCRTRPTAKNLEWAVQRQLNAMSECSSAAAATTAADNPLAIIAEQMKVARAEAQAIMNDDAEWCFKIGEHGLPLLQEIWETKKKKWKQKQQNNNEGGTETAATTTTNDDDDDEKVVLNILTHCNAGWLAFVDHGSATSPIYAAHDAGMPVHVWVDETRPRNQGASLTAWELLQHGVPHTVIADNTGGHLMQHGLVDVVITGADRVLGRSGDVCNKIGTYLKALAAKDNHVPMVVALPSSTFDWELTDGVSEIPIEKRDPHEVRYIQGLLLPAEIENENKKEKVAGAAEDGIATATATTAISGSTRLAEVLVCPPESPAANYAFDVTPSRLVDWLITERGVCAANPQGILQLYPEQQIALEDREERERKETETSSIDDPALKEPKLVPVEEFIN